jgi:hypothetical protein
MHPQKRTMILVNLIGGTAVLGSYAYGLLTYPDAGTVLWGGVPEALRPLYTVSMLSATVGYFAFTGFLLFAVDPDRVRLAGRFGFGLFNALYALILIASALWIPLTFAVVEAPSNAMWLATRLDLGVVAIASAALLVALLAHAPRRPIAAYALAVLGLVAFSFQTVVLDALVWPAYF